MHCGISGNYYIFSTLCNYHLTIEQINQKDTFGNTALIYAINKNDVDFFNQIFSTIDNSVLKKMFNEPDNEGIVPLFNIIKKSNIDISEILNIIDINDKDPEGNTAIIYTAYYNNPSILNILIKKHIIIETKKFKIERGLYTLRDDDNQRILENVLSKIYIKNKLGMSALMYACEKGYSDIVEIIMDFTTEKIKYKNKYEFRWNLSYIFDKNNEGETCLILASKNGHLNIANQLLNNILISKYLREDFSNYHKYEEGQFTNKYEKYINHRDNKGKSALDYACLNNHYFMIEFLKDKWVEESEENKECTKLITKQIASAPDILPTKTNVKIYRELPIVPDAPPIDFAEPIVLEKDPTIFKAEPISLEEDMIPKKVNNKKKQNLISLST